MFVLFTVLITHNVDGTLYVVEPAAVSGLQDLQECSSCPEMEALAHGAFLSIGIFLPCERLCTCAPASRGTAVALERGPRNAVRVYVNYVCTCF